MLLWSYYAQKMLSNSIKKRYFFEIPFFMYLFVKLLRSDVSSAEGQDRVFTENSACNSVPISLSELVLSKIRAYHGRLLLIKTGVYHVVKARGRELI